MFVHLSRGTLLLVTSLINHGLETFWTIVCHIWSKNVMTHHEGLRYCFTLYLICSTVFRRRPCVFPMNLATGALNCVHDKVIQKWLFSQTEVLLIVSFFFVISSSPSVCHLLCSGLFHQENKAFFIEGWGCSEPVRTKQERRCVS